jgi:tetratricopeptide (TPR) repeat protein
VNHAELGRFDRALALIREAEPEIGNDPKLGPSLDSAAALVCALLGNRDAALSRIASAERRRQAVPDANETQRSVLWNLGKAAHALGDPSRSETFWRSYLDHNPPPVYLPTAYYHLAEARRLLGDSDEADALYRRAASADFGTLHERLARDRLAAPDGLTTAGPAERH